METEELFCNYFIKRNKEDTKDKIEQILNIKEENTTLKNGNLNFFFNSFHEPPRSKPGKNREIV